MARTTTKNQRTPLLPPGARDFLLRRGIEVTGIALGALAIVLSLILLSYNPGDPSLNSATPHEVTNWLGPLGAYVADILLQVLGLACVVPVLVLFSWAWRIASKQMVSALWLRLVVLCASALLLSIALNGPTPPQWAGLKFFNVYGPNEYHKGGQKSVVAHVFPDAKENMMCRLFKSHHPDYEDGGQLRDFIWVGDVVEVILWLYENQNISGLFNVGTGKARSFKDLANAVYVSLGLPPKIHYIDTPANIRDKYQYFTEADMTKLREAGYDKAFTELEEGVRQYVQDYLSQDDPHK
jgi:hypothetical protein